MEDYSKLKTPIFFLLISILFVSTFQVSLVIIPQTFGNIMKAIAIVWCVTTSIEILWRLLNGVTINELSRTAFKEVVGIRWMLKPISYLCFLTSISLGALILYNVWAMSNYWYSFMLHIEECLYIAALSFTLVLLIYIGKNTIRSVKETDIIYAPPSIDVKLEVGEFGDNQFKDIGIEEFPISAEHRFGKAICLRLLIILTLLCSYWIFNSFKAADAIGLFIEVEVTKYLLITAYSFASSKISAYAPGFELIFPIVSTIALAQITFINRNYLYFSQSAHAILTALLVFLSGYWTAFARNPAQVSMICFAIFLLPVVRLFMDIVKLVRYRRRLSHVGEIATALQSSFKADLAAIPDSSFGQYQSVNFRELSDRLARGATNVNAVAMLSPPMFGRYMRNVHAQTRRCASATAKFMTVDRDVIAVNPRPTYEPLYDTAVPVWNEDLFPLDVPSGYQTLDQTIRLGQEWQVVRRCGNCFGSGRSRCVSCSGTGSITRTQTRTEPGQSTTRTVTTTYRETCSRCGGDGTVHCMTCSGHGRLKFDRELVTSWKHDSVCACYPAIANADLIKDAEEFDVAVKRLVEDRSGLAEPARILVAYGMAPAGLEQRMDSVQHMSSAWSDSMSKLLGGTLYRSEIKLGGFTTIRCSFRGMLSNKGFFFGNHPKLHFPRLPMDLGVIAALVTVPTMLLVTCIWAFAMLSLYWKSIAM